MDSMLANMDPAVISAIMSDPEIMRIISNPDTMQKVQMIMDNPARANEFAADRDIMYLLQKMQGLGLNQNRSGGRSPAPIPNPWAGQGAGSASVSQGVITVISKSQFDQIVQTTKQKVVCVDFTATWCGPCRHISPVFDRLSTVYSASAVFLKVDVDKNRDIAMEKSIHSMPTFHFYADGQLLEEFSGADSGRLENIITKYVEKFLPKAPAILPSPYTAIPLRENELVHYQACKFDIIKQKMIEFNSDPECKLQLTKTEMSDVSSLIDTISDRSSFHRTTISNPQKDVVLKIVANWDSAHLPPILNLIRIAVLHPSFDSFISFKNLVLVLDASKENSDSRLAALRTLCNLFLRVPFKQMLVDNFDELHEKIRDSVDSRTAPIRLCYLNVLINYTIILLDSKITTTESCHCAKIQLLSIATDALQTSKDEKAICRLLIIIGSLLFRDSTCKAIAQSLQVAQLCEQAIQNFSSTGEVSSVCAEVVKTLQDEDN